MTRETFELRSQDSVRKSIFYNQCRFLERQYDEIRALQFFLDLDTAEFVFRVYCEYVKVLDPRAGKIEFIKKIEEVINNIYQQPNITFPENTINSLRNLLATQLCDHGKFLQALEFCSPNDPGAVEVQHLLKKHKEKYGNDINEFREKGYALDRGVSLIMYFESNSNLVREKTVAHIAPEHKLRDWFEFHSNTMSISYLTIDGFSPDVHQHHDLCEMDLPDNVFDTIICHRVMEHILDQNAALGELYRVLKPGGVLNISVPELFFIENSIEWNIPDPNWHDHVRIYGQDFPHLLRQAGFDVKREDWLINQRKEDLIAQKAFPLLMYNAFK